MTAEEIRDRLSEQFGAEVVLDFIDTDPDEPAVYDPPQISIAPERIAEVAQFCRDDDALKFDSLMCLGCVDRGEDLSVVYHLHSMTLRHKAALRADVPRTAPSLPTVELVWKTANWHEREAYDMMGIVFEGHSDLRTILLPEDWEGHPLRKDYEVQEYYKGMKVPY